MYRPVNSEDERLNYLNIRRYVLRYLDAHPGGTVYCRVLSLLVKAKLEKKDKYQLYREGACD